jgi:muconolactone D-isomerase
VRRTGIAQRTARHHIPHLRLHSEDATILFHVTMAATIPDHLDSEVRADLLAQEKARAQELQRQGVWLHLWRVVGRYSNVSVFDVETNEQLHDLLWTLPLFPYMQIEITPLAAHPSAVEPDRESSHA